MSVHDELAMYTDAGIPAVDALRSATSINARVLGIDGRTGSIRPGLRADLVAVRGTRSNGSRISKTYNAPCAKDVGRPARPDAGLQDDLRPGARRCGHPDLLDYVDGKLVNRPGS